MSCILGVIMVLMNIGGPGAGTVHQVAAGRVDHPEMADFEADRDYFGPLAQAGVLIRTQSDVRTWSCRSTAVPNCYQWDTVQPAGCPCEPDQFDCACCVDLRPVEGQGAEPFILFAAERAAIDVTDESAHGSNNVVRAANILIAYFTDVRKPGGALDPGGVAVGTYLSSGSFLAINWHKMLEAATDVKGTTFVAIERSWSPVALAHEFGHWQGLLDGAYTNRAHEAMDHNLQVGSIMFPAIPSGWQKIRPYSMLNDGECRAFARPVEGHEPKIFSASMPIDACSVALGGPDAGVPPDAGMPASPPAPAENQGGCSYGPRASSGSGQVFFFLVTMLAAGRMRRRQRSLGVVALIVLTLCSCNRVFEEADRFRPDSGREVDSSLSTCTDLDSDSYGLGCPAGPDCDDQSDVRFPGAEESCDGVDNDCDGETDEGTIAGSHCAVSNGACSGAGIYRCDPFVGPICALINELIEYCDGLDNDCDGEIDTDAIGVGEPCSTGLLGVCSAGVMNCIDAEWVCEPIQQASVELCNGLNDDCDTDEDGNSLTDEGANGGELTRSCYTGPAPTESVGVCVAGVRSCVQGALTGCFNQVLPSAEICDQLDNDCDGESDEGLIACGCTPLGATQDCYSGPEGTKDVGTCHGGTQSCTMDGSGTSWADCTGEIVPEIERCTPPAGVAADEDCDGEFDEEFFFGDFVVELGDSCSLGIGGCRAQGIYACSGVGTVYCTAEPSIPLPEICNGIDDNCNGQTDEAPVGGNCTVGIGACARNGVEVCNDESLECNVEAGAPALETCNGIDDDCNGVIDNVLLGGTVRTVGEPCALGEGVCADDGEWECDGEGGIRCDATPREPGPEVCDGLDNDCDGVVNNGLGVGNLCEGRGTCPDGVWECAPDGDVACSTLPDGSQFDPDEHIEMMHCDGLDNDCNGLVDDYFFNLGDPCTLSCPGVFLEGTYICQDDGSWTVCTVQMGGPDYPTEVCDGMDNNCNWATDEGFNIGTPCGVGVCAGVVVCDGPNATTCNGASPGVEICNGIDDDCDGEIDEGNPGGGVACDGSDADLCNEGVTSCVGGSLTCTDSTGDNPELCNGQDDDCNPATVDGSNEPGMGSACDGNDADQCNEGVTSCVGGSTVCGDATGDSVEVCNGQDDDCDGATDEGFNLGAACDGKGECGPGTRECDGAGGARCSTDVGGSQDQHVPETTAAPHFNCSDGLDNDCDDLIDTGPGGDPDCN